MVSSMTTEENNQNIFQTKKAPQFAGPFLYLKIFDYLLDIAASTEADSLL